MSTKKIKDRMAKKHIGQRELSRQSGLTLSVVHNIISGRTTNPTVNNALRLADALDLTLDEIARE